MKMWDKEGKSSDEIAKKLRLNSADTKTLKGLMNESYLNERFGGDTNIPADKKTTEIIQNPKSKILINVPSTLNKTARFVVVQRPLGHRGELRKNTDKVLMATISDPKKGRIKMFAYHGSHVSHQKAMDFAKHHKLVAREDAKGNPLYAKESYLDEAKQGPPTFVFNNNQKAKQFAKDIANSGVATGTVSGNRVIDVKFLKGSPKVARAAIAKYLKQNRGKAISKSVAESYLGESVISKLQESYTSKIPVDININEEILHVTPDISEDIIYLHDELNEDNQLELRNLIESDLKSFAKIANFAKKRN